MYKLEDIAVDLEQLGRNQGAIDVMFSQSAECSNGCGIIFNEGALGVFINGEIYKPGCGYDVEMIKQSLSVLVKIHYDGQV